MKNIYPYLVISIMFLLPIFFIIGEGYYGAQELTLNLFGKWFIFWAIGVRLFTAGIVQLIKSSYTLRDILGLNDLRSSIIVRELGFANISIGLLGLLSLFLPSLRIAAAGTGGLFMGLCGLQHALNKEKSLNQKVAMASDLALFFSVILFLVLFTF